MAKRDQSKARLAELQAKAKAREKEIRAKAAKLKAKGLAFGKTNLRYPAKITKRIADTVADLEGVLTGDLEAIKLPKPSRYKYAAAQSRLSPSGTHAIRPKEEGARRMIKRGMIATVRPLGDGYYLETIELPVNVKSVRQLRKWIESGEPDKLKHEGEYFGFRLQGHASHTALPDAASMHAYLMRYNFYESFEDYELDPENDRAIEFELVRVYPPDIWDSVRATERAEWRASPEFKQMVADRKKRRNESRSTRDRKARKQKKVAPEFASVEQNKLYARGQKLRQYDKAKAKKRKERAARDPDYAARLRDKRRRKEKRQRARGKRK